MYRDFIVDAMGQALVEGEPALTEGWQIPAYIQQFRESLPCEEEEDEDKPGGKPKMPKKECWNCGEAHDLKDCTLPRDYNRINMKKKQFQDAKAAMVPMKTQ